MALWKHQKKTRRLLKKENRVYDTSDPGTGKTRVAIQAWFDRYKKGGGKLLVIAPKSIMENAWGDEIDENFPTIFYSIALANNRDDAFATEADIYITNTDAVKWLAKQPKKFFKNFDTIIVDEITSFKHRTSQRSKALNKIKVNFDYRQGLTGTPNSLSITDIWNQLMFLDDGERLGKAFFHFRGCVCTPTQVGPDARMVRWDDKPEAETAVAGLISDISIRHQFDECMDIPPNVERYVRYTPNRKLIKMYNELEQNAVLELQKEDVTAVNAAVLRNKLLQVASGAVYSSEGEYTVLDSGRYELIAELVDERLYSVVFFNWRHQKEQLEKEFKKYNIVYEVIDGTTKDTHRPEIVREYQAGNIRTILLHPQTGAHGLTLTRGTSTIWSSPIYQADYLKQGKHRIWRGGQTKKTETIMVEALGTVEKKVFERLNTKTDRMVSFLEMIKDG